VSAVDVADVLTTRDAARRTKRGVGVRQRRGCRAWPSKESCANGTPSRGGGSSMPKTPRVGAGRTSAAWPSTD